MDGVFKNCTLHEALAILEEDSDYEVNQIFVEPPEPNIHSVVTAMCSLYGVEPLSSIGRYSAAEKKKIQVPRPAVFTNYNRYMGGTDLMDQNINTYRIGIRGKKWWWPIFTYLIDASICNAWSLSRKSGNPINQLDFRRHIVQTYLLRFRNLPRGPGRPLTSRQSKTGYQVSDELRYDAIAHYLIPCPEGVRRRCGYKYCKSQSRLQCSKCNVGLCAKCNYRFHTQ
ncbi:piggyBac transposable element-derived protein 3-like [Leguminivora glycinivorella]|uniref:piggyBac transposable element-derived protein 3-like n=1 Tax=Leguminivora glycinivorella TaxID=1035111 RepID=UPI00200D8076|nr:piggyBac transposable element-derived protein 3-like [Leguminivora glycinivorella]